MLFAYVFVRAVDHQAFPSNLQTDLKIMVVCLTQLYSQADTKFHNLVRQINCKFLMRKPGHNTVIVET